MICPHCEMLLTAAESRQSLCPVCKKSLENALPPSKTSASEEKLVPEKNSSPGNQPADSLFEKILINNTLAFVGMFIIATVLMSIAGIAFKQGKSGALNNAVDIISAVFGVGGLIFAIVKFTKQSEAERMADENEKRKEGWEILTMIPGIFLGLMAGWSFAEMIVSPGEKPITIPRKQHPILLPVNVGGNVTPSSRSDLAELGAAAKSKDLNNFYPPFSRLLLEVNSQTSSKLNRQERDQIRKHLETFLGVYVLTEFEVIGMNANEKTHAYIRFAERILKKPETEKRVMYYGFKGILLVNCLDILPVESVDSSILSAFQRERDQLHELKDCDPVGEIPGGTAALEAGCIIKKRELETIRQKRKQAVEKFYSQNPNLRDLTLKQLKSNS